MTLHAASYLLGFVPFTELYALSQSIFDELMNDTFDEALSHASQ